MLRSRPVLLLSSGLLLRLALFWSQGVFSAASPPMMGAPVAQPSTLVVNYPTRLTVTSQFTSSPGRPAVPASVTLQSVDAHGAVLATWPMYDDGTHGDGVPGDGLYTMQLDLTAPAPGTLRLRVVAILPVRPGRLTSAGRPCPWSSIPLQWPTPAPISA